MSQGAIEKGCGGGRAPLELGGTRFSFKWNNRSNVLHSKVRRVLGQATGTGIRMSRVGGDHLAALSKARLRFLGFGD